MSRTKTLLPATLAALALVVGLAGCGSSSSDDAAPSTTAAGTATTTTSGGGEDDPTTTTGDSPDTTVVATGGGAFCQDLADIINSDAPEGLDPTDAASYSAYVKEQVQKSRDLLAEAPDSLGSEVGLLVDAQEQLVAELEKVDYDISKVSPDAFDAMDTPELQAATDKLQGYVKDTCGIDIPEVTANTVTVPPATVGP